MDEEKNTQDTVDKAQILEYAILTTIVAEFVRLYKNDSKFERAKAISRLRKLAKEERNKFIKKVDKTTLNALKIANRSVLDEMPKGIKHPKLPPVNNKQIMKDFKKYIKSKGFTVDGQSIESYIITNCDKYFSDIVNGKITLDNAIKKVVKQMSKDGLQFVYYPKTRRNIDVFARQSLLWAQKTSTQDTRNEFAKENEITIFEIDAHADSRPSHQYWQGKRYDTTGKGYPTFEQLSNGHGSLEDYGCLHRAYPVFDKDSKPAWSEEELKNINTKPFSFKEKKYTGYEAKEQMRAYERRIRALKREKNILKSQNITDNRLNMQLKQANKEYKEFCKAYGTYPRNNRTRMITK